MLFRCVLARCLSCGQAWQGGDSVVGAAAANRGKAIGRTTIAPFGPPSAARRSVAVAAMAAVAALAAIVAATAAARAVIAAEVDARLHAHQVEQVEAQPQQPGTRYLIQFALFESAHVIISINGLDNRPN